MPRRSVRRKPDGGASDVGPRGSPSSAHGHAVLAETLTVARRRDRAAERPLVQGGDGGAGLVPEAAAGQPFQLLRHRVPFLRRRLREHDAGPPQQRVVAQQVQRDRRARLQIAARRLQADHLMRLQVDDRGAGSLAQRGGVVPQQLDLVEGERAAQLAGLHALDVVHVAEDARDRFRLVAAGVADRVADQVDRPAFQVRRRDGGQGQRRRRRAVALRPFHFQQRQVVLVVDAHHGADAVAGAGHALVAGAVIHPRRDAGTELPAAVAVLDEELGRAPRRHQHVVVDQEAGAGPVVFGMAEQLDAADAALGHLDVLALVFQQVPERRRAAEVAVVDLNGRPAVDQQHALQAARLFRREVGDGVAQDLFQPGRAQFEQPADGLALPAEVRLPGRPHAFRLGHGRRRVRLGGGVGAALDRAARRTAARTWAGSCQPRISWRSCRTTCSTSSRRSPKNSRTR